MTPQELEAWIERHNLTRDAAAQVLGLSKSQVFRYLAGEVEISKPVASVCRAIDRHPDLMGIMP